MSKLCIYNWNGILNDIIPELAQRHELVSKPEQADLIIIWNEIERGGWKDIIRDAHKRGAKVLLYQQGVRGIDRVQPPFNEKLDADVICVWGVEDMERLMKYNVPEDKIHVTGCPLLNRLKPKVEHQGKNVLFALEHWDTQDIAENMVVSSKLRELKKFGGVKVITKALEGENNLDIYENVVATRRDDQNHIEKVMDLLTITDVVVALSESTLAFLAECMDIPVLIADIWIPKARAGEEIYKEYKHTFSPGVRRVCMEDLNKKIMWTLKYPEFLKEERKQTSINLGGADIKDPQKQLIDIINDICN
jgi:hypothetical protein